MMSDPTPNSCQPPESELPTLQDSSRRGLNCCGLSRMMAAGLGAVAAIAVVTVAYLAGHHAGAARPSGELQWNLPTIDATASASSEKFSIATGQVSDDAEGLFVLDHNSGVLQCNVMYPRIGKFMAQFTTNVAQGLGTGGKGGQYIMVTGQADFPSSSNQPAGACVVYVMDANSGNYAVYGVPFSSVIKNRVQQQSADLVLIFTGSGNPLIDRDNLR